MRILAFITILAGVNPSLGITQEREEVLDEHGQYRVHWSIDYDNKMVTFNVTCETLGFVGFGLSATGGMTGADIVIGGFNGNEPYFKDYHGVGFMEPMMDDSQDWEFLKGFENSTHTHLEFRRSFDPCDEHDIAFTNDTTRFIWSFGTSDAISYHGPENRGSSAVNMLDPELPPLDTSKYSSFQLMTNITIPTQDTTYWCTFLQSPSFNGTKHHIVAFDTVLTSPEAKQHTHHYTIFKCSPPSGQNPDEYFSPYVGGPGSECWTSASIPSGDCKPMLYMWSKGGKMFSLPEEVGYPVGESGLHEYFIIEVHFDNPQLLSGVKVETGAVIYYTDEPRSIDADMYTLGHDSTYSITLPAKTQFQLVGHCTSECLSKYVPLQGINIFAASLHSHLTGWKHKLRQFRNDIELPWVAYNDNYDFNYQQTRLLQNHVKVLPGDQLAAECYYDTEARNDTTIGGLSAREEMCLHFVWYYPKNDLAWCTSVLPWDKILENFGILEMNGDLVVRPESLANKTFYEVVDQVVDWTPEFTQQWQDKHLLDSQENRCAPDVGPDTWHVAGYPQAQEYEPPSNCN